MTTSTATEPEHAEASVARQEDSPSSLPLDGITVLDFSQFLSGPMATMRLADLGARVIKVERPTGGDIGRGLAFAGIVADGDTLSFHIANRNKESFAANLKNPADVERVRKLISRVDVIVENFRPGVMERLGLDYESLRHDNPRLVYASVTGFGRSGPWKDRPGQDLLAQSVSGLPWLNGTAADPPVPVGIALADIITSIHLAQGITALLLRRERSGQGGRVDTSLLESMLDLQFELVSAKLHDADLEVHRGGAHSAHAFLPAPYGVYPTGDGFIAIAMNDVPTLGRILAIDELAGYVDDKSWWTEQPVIAELLAARLSTAGTDHWLGVLDAEDIWTAPVLTLDALMVHPGFEALDFTQQVDRSGTTLGTTRSPLRVDGEPLRSRRGAPYLGEHTGAVAAEFDLDDSPAR